MQILIQSAGAQAGYLIEDQGMVEASYELNDGENVCATRYCDPPVANQLPESIIQYVIRPGDCHSGQCVSRRDFINEPLYST